MHSGRTQCGLSLLFLITICLTAGTLSAQDFCCDRYDSCQGCSHGWLSQPTATGDWGGYRTCLGECGINFTGDITQYYQGVTNGGLRERFRYGAHADYVLDFDMDKLAGRKGMFLKVRGESQFGEFINGDTGAILAANTSGLIPEPGEQNTALTEFVITQALSESFAVFAGKVQTFDGDMNAFAHGRGKTQFMNVGLVANPIAFRTVPYSSWGTGFVILNEGAPLFTFTVIDPVDRATTFNLDDAFSEGVTLNAELRVPTNFGCLPGHQLIAGTWSSRDVALLSQNPRLILPPNNQPLQTASDSWSVYWNFDQYLYVDRCNPQRGWGIFGRAAVADDDTNPLEWFLSFGVGGNSWLCGREADRFGLGWFYAPTSDQLPGVLLSNSGHGFEVFYNIAATPWLEVTTDIQLIDPARRGVEDALVLGLRAKTNF